MAFNGWWGEAITNQTATTQTLDLLRCLGPAGGVSFARGRTGSDTAAVPPTGLADRGHFL